MWRDGEFEMFMWTLVIGGAALRAGQISTQDAIARSLLAKQIFNGVRIYLTGAKLLSDHAKPVPAIDNRARPHTAPAQGE